jgi:hypothetical protein
MLKNSTAIKFTLYIRIKKKIITKVIMKSGMMQTLTSVFLFTLTNLVFLIVASTVR